MLNTDLENVVLGGGCFWCTEAIFNKIKGIVNVVSGYAGGDIENPSYVKVSGGETKHAEVVEITYDPQIINFEKILEVFFDVHDPTTLNAQGSDIGTQYRSVIFYTREFQKNEAIAYINNLKNKMKFKNPIVTEVLPLINFYKAEDYHQDFYAKNSGAPYCALVISPKIDKLIKNHEKLLK